MTRQVLCLVLLLALTAAGCGHGRRQAPVAHPPSEAAITPGETSPPQPGPAAPGSLPIPDLGYNAREGRAVYRHYCLTCHGEEGHGDGFNAFNLDPKPRDLAEPAFQVKKTDEDLAAVIRSGGGVAGLSTGMPPWGRTLSERKIRNLVDYLRALRNPSP
jgi:mono/diheme cytochrome c family protein